MGNDWELPWVAGTVRGLQWMKNTHDVSRRVREIERLRRSCRRTGARKDCVGRWAVWGEYDSYCDCGWNQCGCGSEKRSGTGIFEEKRRMGGAAAAKLVTECRIQSL